MSIHEERLDRYIDALNAGKPTSFHDRDPELAGLFETVDQLHSLREAHIPAKLAAALAGQLRADSVIMAPDSHPERQRRISANGVFAPGETRSTALRSADDAFRETSSLPRHRARQIIQFAGAVIAFTLFGLMLVLIFQGAGDGNNLPAAAPPPVGQIAFAAGYDGYGDIYLVNADGSGLTNLTNHPATDWMPSWSPDGSRIAFVSDRNGTGQIYTMNADGSNVQPLASGIDMTTAPVWSPDGTMIAMIRHIDDAAGVTMSHLYVINSDGSDPRSLTEGVPVTSFAWSPDSVELAVAVGLSGRGPRVLVYRADGSGERALTDSQHFEFSPVWSPDGKHIALEEGHQTTPDIVTFSVKIVDANGQNSRPLTDELAFHRMPAWSPDGRYVAVVGNDDRDSAGIYVVSVESPDDVQYLESTDRNDVFPVWSPDSRQIAFFRSSPSINDPTNQSLMVINADGTGLTELAADFQMPPMPAWRPTASSAQRD